LYILMWVSFGILEDKKLMDKNLSILYYVQLWVNALWSIFFFVLKWRLFSFIWIILLDILVIWMVIRMYKKDKTAGLLQIPYILWILFATYLTLAFYLLNN
jgi:tryptophan-rich sensory protein